MALLESINSTENVSPAKINDCISTVNSAIGGGAINQRLVKNSANDFDSVWANPENIAKYTGVAFPLNTIEIGSSYNIATINSSYVGNANQIVKVYSLSTPTRYFIGALESATTSANCVVRIHINSDESDSVVVSDWVIVPYNYEVSTDFVYGSLIFDDTQTDIFTNINAGGLSGASGIDFQMQGSKIGNRVTINGGLSVLNTVSISSKKISVFIDLDPKYQHKNQVGELSAINGIFPITGVVYNSSSTTVDQILSGFAYFETTSQLVLQLNGNNAIASSKDVYFYFNINYIASNYSI